MRTKLLSSIVVGTMALAGVASADPIVRDHRYQPTVTVQPAVNVHARFDGRLQLGQRPVIQSNVAYGYQLDRDGDSYTPYAYGNDPWVEYAPRSSWMNLAEDARIGAGGFAGVAINGQPLSVLELQAERSNVTVDRVRIELKDGRTLMITPDRILDARHSPNLRIDLGANGACGVVRAIVYGQGGGTFRVLGA